MSKQDWKIVGWAYLDSFYSAILLSFIKLPFVIKTFVLAVLHRFYCNNIQHVKGWETNFIFQNSMGIQYKFHKLLQVSDTVLFSY